MSDPDSAHARYNSLVRRLVSYERALECADADRIRKFMRAIGCAARGRPMRASSDACGETRVPALDQRNVAPFHPCAPRSASSSTRPAWE
jgi:hypothetical protein